MICREETRGGEKFWLFVAQTEHAALASYLACHWANFPGLSAAAREQLLVAILTHDNGWDAWEAQPEFDPVRGRPYQFTEMPGATALPIWTASIDACEALGPLAGYACSGHFSAMLEHHREHLTATGDQKRAAKFLQAEEVRRERCARSWSGSPEELTLAVGYLQAFDAISLWFCCAPRTEPAEFAVPRQGDKTFRFTPDADNRELISIAPWPLSVEEAALSLEADLTPAARYKSWAALQDARQERSLLEWTLVPGTKRLAER